MNPTISESGSKRWYNDQGQFHRTDGPALIYADGYQSYWINGERHRIDGPAVIHPDGYPEYWIYGNKLTEEEYYDIIQSEEHLNWYLLQIL